MYVCIYMPTYIQGFNQEKIRSENGLFTKIRDFKTNSKFENYDIFVYFQICSVANQFTRRLLKNLFKLHFFTIFFIFLQKLKDFSPK